MRARKLVLVLAVLVVLASLAPAARAAGAGGYSMEVLVDGRPIRELPHGARTYVEASRGREYAVRLTNHTGERVAVALAVDGLNSIDARKTTAREATKWILGPWESIVIEGWQTSGSTARRFFFTTEERSYGAWLGRTEDLGAITATFFRERERERPVTREMQRRSSRMEGSESGADAGARAPSPQAPASEDYAATGIGREVDHRVRHVRFEEEATPSAVLDLRYEYRDALVKLGVLPRPGRRDDPLARRERARGFDDLGYAPDPYRCD